MGCEFLTKCGLCSIRSKLSGAPTVCGFVCKDTPTKDEKAFGSEDYLSNTVEVASAEDYNNAVVLINRQWAGAKVEDARIWALIKGAVLRERDRVFPADFFRRGGKK